MRFRALVLAAGYGTRLAPLTEAVPKPLTPVRGVTPLELTLDRLAAAGCEAAAINLHHLGGAIRERLAEAPPGRWRDMEIVFSEEPEILGTSGALAPLADFFSPADAAVVINGDSLCRWPIKKLLRRHKKRGTVATLLFTTQADPARFGGGVGIDKDGRVRTFDPPGDRPDGPERPHRQHQQETELRRLVFAGAQVLSPDLIARVPEGRSETVPTLYRPLLADGARLAAVTTRRPWHDLGTPRRLRNAALGGGVRPWWIPGGRGSWIGPGARVEKGVRFAKTVVEAGAVVRAGARVRRCLILPGAVIESGARLGGCVIGYGATIPLGARVADRLICRWSADATLPAGASVLQDLIYAPLDPLSRS